jgi:hypothetical protein
MSVTKIVNFHGWETYVNRDARIFPYWSCTLRGRITQKKATNVVITGEPGSGKSYMALDIARLSEGLTAGGADRFKLDQVVLRFQAFMGLTNSLDLGKLILFDEPSYAMGKRDWFKEVNKALVLTIESKRFKVHPLLIPIINKALLDKTIRSYLIQFQIEVRDRGKAVVYRISPSQQSEKVYRTTFCHLDYRMLDWDLCSRDSCLDCDKLNAEDPAQVCQIFRARYERKKGAIQDSRYQQAAETAGTAESHELTNEQILERLLEFKDLLVNPETGRLDADMIRIVAKDKIGCVLGHSRAYTLVKLFKYKWPDVFHT